MPCHFRWQELSYASHTYPKVFMTLFAAQIAGKEKNVIIEIITYLEVGIKFTNRVVPMSIRPIPTDNNIQIWCSKFLDRSQAEFCVRYALVFNTLDVGWLEDTLSPSVTYGSQSVLETMVGISRVWEYLTGKMETLCLNHDRQPRCELAICVDGNPCVLMFQPQSAYDRNWLDSPLASLVIKTDDKCLATEFFMITVVPSPSLAERSGIYPGIEEDVHEHAKRFIRPSTDYKGLRFSYYLLDGKLSLDRRMVEESEQVLKAFPGAERRIIISLAPNSEEYDEILSVGFKGFPSVAVFWKGEIIYRHQGLVLANLLITVIKDTASMYVVT